MRSGIDSGRSSCTSATAIIAAIAVALLHQAEVVLLLQHVFAAGGVNQLRQADLRQADVRQGETFATATTTAISNGHNALSAGGGDALGAGQAAVGAAMVGLRNTGQTEDQNESEAQR